MYIKEWNGREAFEKYVGDDAKENSESFYWVSVAFLNKIKSNNI